MQTSCSAVLYSSKLGVFTPRQENEYAPYCPSSTKKRLLQQKLTPCNTLLRALLHSGSKRYRQKAGRKKSTEFDQNATQRFISLYAAASRCELFSWRETALGRLAKIIVLDQFSRNIFRTNAQAFATDSVTLALAQIAISRHTEKEFDIKKRPFLYMPFMHSESPLIHTIAVSLFDQIGMENYLAFAFKHKKIIDKFGRYPHRNVVPNRLSSPKELEFLETPDSSF